MTATARTPVHRPVQRGASLLEILVAVLVVSIGLVGIVRIQLASMRNAESAYAANQATVLAYAIIDAMRSDREAALAGRYNLAKTCTTSTSASGLIADVQSAWLNTIKDTLGNHALTCGEIDCTGADCRVQIFWDDSRATSGVSDASIQVQTRL